MAEENKTNTKAAGKKEGGFDMKLVAGALAIIVIAVAIYAFYGGGKWGSNPVPVQPAQNSTATYGLGSAEAMLILTSFEKAAAIEDYNVTFNQTQNGIVTTVSEARKGNASWVRLEDLFAMREGFFSGANGTNATNDVVCITYESKTRCANLLNNGTIKVAASLKAWQLGDRATNLAQEAGMRALIGAGAVKIDGPAQDEAVNGFATKKITYTFDMRPLTVGELSSLGLSPSDPEILTTSKVAYWVDTKTGLAVKSSATQMQNGSISGETAMEYSAISLESGSLPPAPQVNSTAASFVQFYANSQNDFVTQETCKLQPTPAEVDACYKSMAGENNDWTICGRIANASVYGDCMLIVAQNTKNSALCENLTSYSDDCYIAVASQTGDFSLCKNLKNASLNTACTQAASQGQQQAEADAEKAKELASKENCAADSDCAIFAGVACAPKNTTAVFSNATNPYLACYQGVPCGCNAGFCTFAKNDTYYQCVSKAEDDTLNAYISQKAAEANSSKSNITKVNATGLAAPAN